MECEAAESYTGNLALIAHPVSRHWAHALSNFINGTLAAGLEPAFLHEHNRVPSQPHSCKIRDEDEL